MPNYKTDVLVYNRLVRPDSQPSDSIIYFSISALRATRRRAWRVQQELAPFFSLVIDDIDIKSDKSRNGLNCPWKKTSYVNDISCRSWRNDTREEHLKMEDCKMFSLILNSNHISDMKKDLSEVVHGRKQRLVLCIKDKNV